MMQRVTRWMVIVSLALAVVGGAVVQPVTRAAAQDSAVWTCAQVSTGVTLNVRSGPGVANEVVITQQPGDVLDADMAHRQVANGYTWVPVRLDSGTQGWTILRRLNPCPEDTNASSPSATAPPAATNTASPPAAPTVTASGASNVNTDGLLDRYEIAELARSVVLLADLRGTRVWATGTGTITTPDGLIVTNSHVVEDTDTVAVGLLDDINETPEYRYLGEVVQRNDQIDVALIAIRTDLDGRPVNPAGLNLPYIPAELNPDDVFRGDPVYIFGYPGIGNDFLVVTTGSIVSVENGDVEGQRLPVWYRTDAEIAPGNSGGLVVNGNGQFVGIPTVVESESITGGRLGGIRPVQVALMAVRDGTTPQSDAAALPPAASDGPQIDTRDVTVRHGEETSGEAGMTFHVELVIAGWQERAARLVARVYEDDLASTPLRNPGAPSAYRDVGDVVQVVALLTPCCATTDYLDDMALDLFLPYSVLGFNTPGTYPLKVQIALEAGDGSWAHTLSWEFISVQVE